MDKSSAVALVGTCLILVLSLALPLETVLPGTSGKISGKLIESESRESLPGANIVIVRTSIGAATDSEGDYFILNVAPGTYNVKATMMGYEAVVKTGVRVSSDRTTVVNFSLSQSTIEFREVVVVAERPVVDLGIANSNTILSGQNIKEIPVLQFKDVLSRQMGMEVLDARGLIMRGGREHEISLTLDGMETREGIDNSVYTRVNPDAVQEVEIQSGGFSAQYGNARSGLINIITKEGDSNYTFTIDHRLSIPARKHFGKAWYERERELRLSDEAIFNPIMTHERVVWDNSLRDPVTGDFGALDTLAAEIIYQSWETIASEIDPDDPVYGGFHNRPDLVRELYKWRTRSEVTEYGDKPDVNTNVTFGGPMPVLKNTFFFASGRFERNYYLVRAQQNYFQDWGGTLKITSEIASNLKLRLTGNYIRTSGVNRTDREFGIDGIEADNPTKDDSRRIIETPDAFGWFIQTRARDDFENEIWPYSELSVSTRTRRQIGLNLTHVLSSTTYWDLALDYSRFDIRGRYDAQNRDVTRTITLNDPSDPGYSVTLSGPYALAPQGYYRDEELWSVVEEITGVRIAGSYHNQEDSKASGFHLTGNFYSQVNKYHQINAGLEFTYMDIMKDEYRNYDINDRHWWQWDVSPKKAAVYLQDKIEFKGIISSIGLRADFSIPSRWYDIENNPFQAWFSRDWLTIGEGIDNRNFNTENAHALGIEPIFTSPKKQIVLSPRFAISHPIGDEAKIFFNYGHFNQLPDPEKRYYFLRRENRRNASPSYIGNPFMDYERTIQYEVGYAQSILDALSMQITGYYKDVTNLARQFSLVGSRNFSQIQLANPDTLVTYFPVIYTTWSNSGTEAVRGIEVRFEKRGGRFFTGWINGSYQILSGGRVGFQRVFQDTTRDPIQFQTQLTQPSARPTLNVSVNFHTPRNFGPRFLGIHPIAEINLNVLFWMTSQLKIDHDPIPQRASEFRNFQNLQWRVHRAVDLRFSKRFGQLFYSTTPVFYIQIQNVFNHKNMFRGAFKPAELDNYLNSLKLDEGDRPGDYKKSYIRLPDPEPFYLFLNPRQIFVGLRLEML